MNESNHMKILMVDDDEDDYVLTRQMLAESRPGKYILDWADSFDAGWSKIRAGTYDAVLMDYDLGPHNGLDLTRKAVSNGCRLPIILYTGRGSYEVDLQAMQAGAALYLTKSEITPLLLERGIRYAIERKQSEKALAEANQALTTANARLSQQKLELDQRLQESSHILESIQDGFFSVDRDWTITYMNHRASRAGGYEPEQVIGKNFWEVFPKVKGTEIELQYRRVMDARTPIQFEAPRDYQTKLYNLNVYPSVDGISVFAQDISERKLAEQALERSRQEQTRLASFPELNPNPILEIDLVGKIHYLNPHGQKLFPDLNEKGLAHAFLAGWEKILGQVRTDPETPWVRVIQVDGKDYQQSIFFYKECELIRVYGMDISTRMQALRALQESERKQRELAQSLGVEQAKLSAVLQNLPVGVWITDQNGRITGKNKQADIIWAGHAPLSENIDGYRQYQAWDGETGQELQPEDYPLARVVRTRVAVEPHEQRIRRFDGSEGIVLVSVEPIFDEQSDLIGTVAINVDITERKQMEESLRLSEERFGKAFNATPIALVVSRLADGQIEQVNDAFVRLYGYSRGEALGKTSLELNMFAVPVTRKDLVEKVQAAHSIRDVEVDICLKSGQIRQVNLNIERLTINGEDYVLTVVDDITDRKQAKADLERYTQRLEQSNRELQDFTFMASHDMQEPLRKVLTFSERLQTQAGPKLDADERDYLDRMRKAAGRMSTMLDGLLAYARVSTNAQPFEPVDLARVAAKVWQDLEDHVDGKGSQVEIGALPIIEAEPAQMYHLLQNLLGNALKFARPGVPPNIKICSCRLDKAAPGGPPMVEIRVEDKGIGFDPQEAGQLFQPFHRLVGRSQFEGSGMGLAICRKIVERHGGTITAQGQTEQGAVFIVQLPVKQAVLE